MSNERAWLDGLKAGDTVARTRSYGQVHELRTVIRTTPTMVVICEGQRIDGVKVEGRYQRKSGRGISGDAWSRQYITEPTPRIKEEIAVDALKRNALTLRESLPVPTDRAGLEAFIAALTPLVPVKKETNQ